MCWEQGKRNVGVTAVRNGDHCLTKESVEKFVQIPAVIELARTSSHLAKLTLDLVESSPLQAEVSHGLSRVHSSRNRKKLFAAAHFVSPILGKTGFLDFVGINLNKYELQMPPRAVR